MALKTEKLRNIWSWVASQPPCKMCNWGRVLAFMFKEVEVLSPKSLRTALSAIALVWKRRESNRKSRKDKGKPFILLFSVASAFCLFTSFLIRTWTGESLERETGFYGSGSSGREGNWNYVQQNTSHFRFNLFCLQSSVAGVKINQTRSDHLSILLLNVIDKTEYNIRFYTCLNFVA